ncbi:MAG: hypothetical protein DCC49_11245 [Acidobacteria bacterium]|nr:MAG: hypothetical protein DCC49_11245 [Acidobacteriota bacterium]
MITLEPHPFGELIGLEVTEANDGVAVTRLEVQPELLNPHGVLHGGVLFSMADTAMGAAVKSLLDEAELCASIEVHIRFLAPCKDGTLTSVTEVVGRGKRVMQLESRITDASGRLIATATGAFAVLAA